jgi:hypothetical protein
VTFRDKDIKSFFVTKIFSHVAERLFYFAKKLSKQNVLVLEGQKSARTSQKTSHTASHTHGKILMALPHQWRKQLNYS